jgi:uncharacterized membrane protein YgcG
MKLLNKFMNASNIQQGNGISGIRLAKQMLASILAVCLVFATCPDGVFAFQDQDQQSAGAPANQGQAPPYQAQTPEQLQQLVAPIALYPDSLVAQILPASTYPEQVVEADRWLQAHPELKGEDLAKAVDQQNWDPSVKALTAFPSVLGNMDKNISWTSSLGDAYFNQEQDVMNAIQVMRQKAQQAGNLQSTPQQTVTQEGSNIVIQPANPEIVYVPAYDPWVVYGYPIAPWPYWYPYPGIWFGGPSLFFGVGFGIGFFGGFGWGWPHWGFDWGHRYVFYNHARYYSRSATFYNRSAYYRGTRPGYAGHPGGPARPFGGDTRAARGYEPGRAGPAARPAEPHSNAFGGYEHGGQARGEESRGRASFGGGGFHGGGSHGGGGRR